MTNVMTKSLLEKYLRSLSEDEAVIEAAAEAYETAKATLDVGLRRYIALRDFVAEQLGNSPYTKGVDWPEQFTADGEWVERGRFRFTGKAVGDAVVEVLRERREERPENHWLPLAQIIDSLSAGGLGFPEPVQARAVNAALLKTSGVKRGVVAGNPEAYYRFDDEGGDEQDGRLDPDDLPFE